MNKVNNKTLNYSELRREIHKILYEFYKCDKKEKTYGEWLECKTDDILELIKRQGGNY